MWKHWLTVTIISFSIVLVGVFLPEQLFLAILLGAFLLGIILFLGVTQVRFNYFVKSINHGNKGVSLTFDDGPDPITTPKILTVLDKHDVKGTFFLIGSKIKGNESLVKEVVNRGHIIGNHSFSHDKLLPTKGSKVLKKEFDDCGTELENLVGKTPKFLRIPFGLATPNYYRALKAGKYIPIGWDFRTFDTMYKDTAKLKNEMLSKMKTASIVLLHDANEITLEVLDDVISECKKSGIKFVPLDENIGKSAYS